MKKPQIHMYPNPQTAFGWLGMRIVFKRGRDFLLSFSFFVLLSCFYKDHGMAWCGMVWYDVNPSIETYPVASIDRERDGRGGKTWDWLT